MTTYDAPVVFSVLEFLATKRHTVCMRTNLIFRTLSPEPLFKHLELMGHELHFDAMTCAKTSIFNLEARDDFDLPLLEELLASSKYAKVRRLGLLALQYLRSWSEERWAPRFWERLLVYQADESDLVAEKACDNFIPDGDNAI